MAKPKWKPDHIKHGLGAPLTRARTKRVCAVEQKWLQTHKFMQKGGIENNLNWERT
jgi:hypothetical protein